MKVLGSVVLALSLLLVPVVMVTESNAADFRVGDIIKITYGSAHSGDGGEFRISGPVPSSGRSYDFETFCLERNETISVGGQYRIASVGNVSVAGGVGGIVPAEGGDPISEESAYLYYGFRHNSLSLGYLNTDDDADALQKALWWLEDELLQGGQRILLTNLSARTQYFIALAQNAVAGGWLNNGRVVAINLVDKNTGQNKQTQYGLVPEPSALLLLGLGLTAIGIYRRKMS